MVDAQISFRLGDFGLGTDGEFKGEGFTIFHEGNYSPLDEFPVGDITGQDLSDDKDDPIDSFSDYAGVTVEELSDFFVEKQSSLSGVFIESASATTEVTSFDGSSQYIVFNGTLVNPNAPASGTSVSQVGADVVIDFGSGDTVVLLATQLADW